MSSESPQTPDPSPAASLEQLRDRVTRAADEILRLREANQALAERIARLESEERTVVTFDDDPEALREKIAGFIEAIDRFLDPQEDDAPASEA